MMNGRLRKSRFLGIVTITDGEGVCMSYSCFLFRFFYFINSIIRFVCTSKKGWFLCVRIYSTRVAQFYILYETNNKNFSFAAYFLLVTISSARIPFILKLYEVSVEELFYFENYFFEFYLKNVFFFLADCFINFDIEMGI